MTHCTEQRKGLRGFKDSSVELVIIHYMGFFSVSATVEHSEYFPQK